MHRWKKIIISIVIALVITIIGSYLTIWLFNLNSFAVGAAAPYVVIALAFGIYTIWDLRDKIKEELKKK